MKQKKKKRFWEIYAAVLGGFVFLMAVLLIIGYNAMVDYDEAQGYIQTATAEIVESFEKGDYDILFGKKSRQNVAMIFEKSAYEKKLDELIKKDGISYRKGFSSDRYSKPVYDIFAGKTKIASVEFSKSGEESKFGFDTFQIEKIVPKYEGKYEVSVAVPEGATLYLNDKEVPESIVVKSESARYGKSNSLHIEDSVGAEKCTISGLLDTVTPKIVYKNGAVATLAYDKELSEWYCVQKEIQITAPSNCIVSVNGIVVSEDERFVRESEIAADLLETAYTVIDKPPVTLVKYAVSGLEKEESVEVSAEAFNGSAMKVLKDDVLGNYEVQYLSDEAMLENFGTDKDFLIARAEDYTKFMHGKASKSEILAYVMKDTFCYESIDSYWVTFTNHNSYWFENQTVTSLEFYDEDLFSATVHLDYCIKGFAGKNDATKEWRNIPVTFFYANTSEGLKIVDFYLHQEEGTVK